MFLSTFGFVLLRSWRHSVVLPGPVRVTYEAGPTGFGLARAITEAGMECVVAAPSKLQRPAGDRVKTDARDAAHLARLLRLGEITAVTVPEREMRRSAIWCGPVKMPRRSDAGAASVVETAAAARDRLFRWEPWTACTRSGCAAALRRPRTAAAFDTASTRCWPGDRRDRLEKRSRRWPPDSGSPRCARLGCLRGISALTAFALTVEIGDWSRFTGSSIGAYVGLVPSEYSSGNSACRDRSPRPATPTCADC